MTPVQVLSAWRPTGEVWPSALSFSEALNSGTSGWTMTLPFDEAAYLALTGSGAGVRVMRPGRPFVGVAKRVETDGDTIQVSGVPLLSLLADRVAIPEPGNVSGPWTTDAAQAVTGESVAAWVAFLDDHVGAGAVAARRLPQSCTVVADGVSTSTVAFLARWSPDLLSLVQEHATASGVAVEADLVRDITNTDTELVFTVRPLVDRLSMVFDPDLGSVASWRVLHVPDIVTHAYAGGSGDGVARTQRVRSQTGPRRVERWVETSGEDDEVDAAADAALVAGGSATTLEVELSESGPVFGTDFEMGDRVTIRIAGVGQVSDRVTAVESRLVDGGLVSSVRVGSGAVRLLGDDDLRRRIGRLEGR